MGNLKNNLMLKQISSLLETGKLFNRHTPLLLACSGGRDSMALLDVLLAAGCTHLEVAHVNFKLRGEESDGDEAMVQAFCKQYQLPFHVAHFETQKYAVTNGLSIQMAARTLRYDWLEQKRKERKLHLIVTAHHQDDQAETILFNILQGTGLEGLKGMTQKNGVVIRPLLHISRKEIDTYIDQRGISYRDDSSNDSTYYKRNFIRLEVMPLLEQINPSVKATLDNFGERMRQTNSLFQEQVERIRKKVLQPWKDGHRLYLTYILQHPSTETLLYEMLKDFGVSSKQSMDIMQTLSGKKQQNASGQVFLTAEYRLITDDRSVFILPLVTERTQRMVWDTMPARMVFNEYDITCRKVPMQELNMKSSARYAYLDAAKLNMPLLIRYPETGDYFYPMGLGKAQNAEKPGKKKLSKFFKDIKLSVAERERTPLLFNGEQLVWVIGQRIDDRFKVTEHTKDVWVLQLPPMV